MHRHKAQHATPGSLSSPYRLKLIAPLAGNCAQPPLAALLSTSFTGMPLREGDRVCAAGPGVCAAAKRV